MARPKCTGGGMADLYIPLYHIASECDSKSLIEDIISF